jgi:hypothetical protein
MVSRFAEWTKTLHVAACTAAVRGEDHLSRGSLGGRLLPLSTVERMLAVS